MSGTFLAPSGRLLWRLLERRGIDPVLVFREAGLDPARMDEPRARYPITRMASALTKAEELSADPCLGLEVAETWRPTDLHALGYAFLASSTLGTALVRFVRYFTVINDTMRFALQEEDGHVTISAKFLGTCPPLPQAAEDARWAILVAMCRLIYGDVLDPIKVTFLHPEPPCRGKHHRLFHCPVEFGASRSTLVFAKADLDRPLPTGNRELAHGNDRILSAFLADLTRDDLRTRVKAVLAEQLPNGDITDENIAKAVHLSHRTLQRRLAHEGTSFSLLLDEVRRELAEKYVTDPALNLSEVSYLLGFSEPSAFSRAFRRWTGRSPTQHRKQNF